MYTPFVGATMAPMTPELLARLDRLIAAMEALAASNMALVDQMAKPDEEPDADESYPQPMSRKR